MWGSVGEECVWVELVWGGIGEVWLGSGSGVKGMESLSGSDNFERISCSRTAMSASLLLLLLLLSSFSLSEGSRS